MINFVGQRYENLSYSIIPAGEYLCCLSDIQSKTGNYGDYIVIKWTIWDNSEHKGRVLFDSFAINSDNDSIRFRAIDNLTKLAEAFLGSQNINESNWRSMLLKEAILTVVNKEDKKGEMRNYIYNRKIPVQTKVELKKEGKTIPTQHMSPEQVSDNSFDMEDMDL